MLLHMRSSKNLTIHNSKLIIVGICDSLILLLYWRLGCINCLYVVERILQQQLYIICILSTPHCCLNAKCRVSLAMKKDYKEHNASNLDFGGNFTSP